MREGRDVQDLREKREFLGLRDASEGCDVPDEFAVVLASCARPAFPARLAFILCL